MKALAICLTTLLAPDPPTPSSTKKPIPKKMTPMKLFYATLESLKGAALTVDRAKFPSPDESYAKTLTKADND